MHGFAIAFTGLTGVSMFILGIWTMIETGKFVVGGFMALAAVGCIALAVMLGTNGPKRF